MYHLSEPGQNFPVSPGDLWVVVGLEHNFLLLAAAGPGLGPARIHVLLLGGGLT